MVAQIPRPFRPTEAKRREDERARLAERRDGSRKTSNTTVSSGGRLDIDGGDLTVKNGGNAVVEDGGRFLVKDGGSMDITDNGEVSVTGQGIDGFTNEPIVSKLKFGNREAVHSWTGLSFMQPGVYLEGEVPGDILDTPRLTGVINRDGLITRSGRRQAEGRPANIKEQSSSLCTPWTATIGTIRYDSLINWDGEDGLAGRELGSSFSTSPSVASGLVEDVLNQRSYLLSLSADPLMGGFGKTGAVLAIKSWHMSPSTGWIRVDDGGLIDIQATVGAKSVGVTSEVPGKLELTATDGVNVQGVFTVNGAPVGGAPEWSDVKNKPTTFPPSAHTHTKSQITDFPTTMPPSAHTHTIPDVTGLQAALDAKSGKPGAWTVLTYTTGTPLDGNKPAVRREADGASLRFSGGILFSTTIVAGTTMATAPIWLRPASIKNVIATGSLGVIGLSFMPDGRVVCNTAGKDFPIGGYIDFGSIAPIPTDGPT